MRTDYKDAKKLGDDAVRAAVKNGVSPYLPVLDTLEEIKHSAGEVHVGLMELPISRIRGNKEVGRNNAFANNFMPIFDENSEFAAKWSILYESYKEEGIREAIKCYEYMNWYYVLEGNKRVSVSKYGGSDFILADVIRILPEKSDAKEVRVYYEYLDFYSVTKNYYMIFTEPGEYEKLAELLGQDLEHEWPEQLRVDLKAAFFSFVRKFRTTLKPREEMTVGDSFLIYISIFPFRTLLEDSDEQIVKNLRLARNELLAGTDVGGIGFIDTPPEGEKNGIMTLFSNAVNYIASSPLRVGFVYDTDPEHSRWIGSHELGRFYVDKMTSDAVVTNSYTSETGEGSVSDALQRAVEDKNEIIFTVSPSMMDDTLKAAVYHPEIKFLNCSLGLSHPTVRCYHGRFYEATFLMGILAADTLLLDGRTGERRIAYLIRGVGKTSAADLNAFAIGVSLIDPECRITVKYVKDCPPELFGELEKYGFSMVADFDYLLAPNTVSMPGLYKLGGESETFVGAPYFNWGKYYVQIVQSVLSGAWGVNEIMKLHWSANYWFGLSTGVVDIRTPELPYQTKKLLSFMKNSIVNGSYDPFSGELHSQDGTVRQAASAKTSHISDSLEKMTVEKIAFMDWLNDNIDGELPEGADAATGPAV